MIEKVTPEDELWIKKIFSREKILGNFMWSWATLGRKNHYWIKLGQDGFVHYRKKDGMYEVCEISVAEKKNGIGRKLIEAVPSPITLKTDENSEANKFYKKIGFTQIGTARSRKGKIFNVWYRWV